MRSQTPSLAWPIGYHNALRKVAEIKAELAAAESELGSFKPLAQIGCCRCKNYFPVSTQIYVQTNWYVSPRGCTEGDYWLHGEANWWCPSCGFCNRFDAEKGKYQTIPNNFYRPELIALKCKFLRTVDCYCKHSGLNFIPCENCQKEGFHVKSKALQKSRK